MLKSNRNTGCFAKCQILYVLAIVLVLIPLAGCKGKPEDTGARTVRIGIVYTAPHENVNQIVEGFRGALDRELSSRPAEIFEQHASGDRSQFSSVINAALAKRPDLLVTITTPISQTAIKNKPDNLPMIFLGVTDPIGAGLVDAIDKPVRCTGVSDLAPFEAILKFIRTIQPNAKRVGLPFSPEDQPAIFGRNEIKRLSPKFGLSIDARPVTSTDELAPVISALVNANDVLLIGSDNGMFEAAPLIVRSALGAKKLVFAGDSTSVQAGAIGGYTIDYHDVGVEGAVLAARVLNGEDPGNIPVRVLTEGVLELNRESASQLNMTFPSNVLSEAKTIYPN